MCTIAGMVVNIFPYGIRHAFKGHDMHVQRNTITKQGADFMCRTCYKIDYFKWRTLAQRINAEIYLTLKQSAILEERFKEQ